MKPQILSICVASVFGRCLFQSHEYLPDYEKWSKISGSQLESISVARDDLRDTFGRKRSDPNWYDVRVWSGQEMDYVYFVPKREPGEPPVGEAKHGVYMVFVVNRSSHKVVNLMDVSG